MTEFSIRVQKARYQEMVIAIAEAFQNFLFFQPAFLDSHGYIISAGVFDLHRGDLVRGLIVFDNMFEIRATDEELRDIVATSVAFNYKSFVDNESALYWTKELSVWGFELAERFIFLVAYAKAPYQFLAKVLCDDQELVKLPISQEATACSYQLYSFFLLNTEVAIRTNLLPSNDGKLQDFYSELPREFKDFLRHRFDYYEFIEYKLDQQLIKTVFQLLIQGKTAKDIEVEIKNAYGVFLSDSAAETLSMQFVAFWNLKFPGITNLMKLIDLVGWLCFERERPVHISTHFITKTLDSRSSTCSQFIKLMHSSLIQKVVEYLKSYDCDVYADQECIITSPYIANEVPAIYTQAFSDLGHPLNIINTFILQNLINPECGLHLDDRSYPIHYASLRYYILPIGPNTKNKYIWAKNVESLIESYERYVYDVTAYSGTPDSIQENPYAVSWDIFWSQLDLRESHSSLHYE